MAKKTTRKKTVRKTSKGNRWGAAEVREACKALGIRADNWSAAECNGPIRQWIAENMPKKVEPPNPSSTISGAVGSLPGNDASFSGPVVTFPKATPKKPSDGIGVLRDVLETYSQVTELLKSAGYLTPEQRIAFLEDAKRITEIATE